MCIVGRNFYQRSFSWAKKLIVRWKKSSTFQLGTRFLCELFWSLLMPVVTCRFEFTRKERLRSRSRHSEWNNTVPAEKKNDSIHNTIEVSTSVRGLRQCHTFVFPPSVPSAGKNPGRDRDENYFTSPLNL